MTIFLCTEGERLKEEREALVAFSQKGEIAAKGHTRKNFPTSGTVEESPFATNGQSTKGKSIGGISAK
ncbi:MAG: hypothetical protein SPK23_00205 [Eubacteriales bacterium]|nr:hypothetical protein [Clostridiales bacterium]MDY5835539.1 hypothetical protein [Eubacteriales bacterium]